MLSNLENLGYLTMTEIQAQSLPHVLAGKDLIAKAKTGSGKTAAFALGLLVKLRTALFAPQALVLCPTRELATQVANEIRRLARYRDNIKVLTLCGGQSIGPQIGSLEHGAHVIVGTPGRIQDHIRKGTLDLAKISTVVLDEADRMLDMGFLEGIEAILEQTPARRQTLLFSATYPEQILSMSARIQNAPIEVSVAAVHSQNQIKQHFYQTDNADKPQALSHLLGHYRPDSTVVFCNTKQGCRDVAEYLLQQGHSAEALHGDMEQRERDQVLTQFSHRSCAILVATDVAARGLDIDELSAVINYDLSRDPEIYVHRIGRTGRAGKEGLALSLFSPNEGYKLVAISDYLGQEISEEGLDQLNPDLGFTLTPPMIDLCISGGRKQKVRPGDILGALTGDAGIPGARVGKISIFDNWAYVAVDRDVASKALGRLLNGKIKGRKFKVRTL